jgi:hypothetical protein
MDEEQAAAEAALEVHQAAPADVKAPARKTGQTRRRRGPGARGRKCSATTEAGAPCPVAPMAGRERCVLHEAKVDPTVGALVKSGQKRGGEALRVKYGLDLGDVDLSTPGGCRTALQAVSKAVALGQLASSAAQAVVSAVNAAVRVAELEVAGQIKELERRLDELGETPPARRPSS